MDLKKGDTIEILEDWSKVKKGEKYIVNHTTNYLSNKTISIVKPKDGNRDGNYNIYLSNAKKVNLEYEIY